MGSGMVVGMVKLRRGKKKDKKKKKVTGARAIKRTKILQPAIVPGTPAATRPSHKLQGGQAVSSEGPVL